MRYLSAHYVFPVSSQPLKNGIVCVDNSGCITRVIDTGGKPEERERLEFYSGILVPGFVNAHCHLELSHLRNAITPRGGLPAFISSIGRLRGAHRETILAAAAAADREMTENGIVAAGDVSNGVDTLYVKRDSRIRYRTFVEVFGLDGNRAENIFAAARRAEQQYRAAGMCASIVPHAVYSTSQALWQILYGSYLSAAPQVVSMHHQESEEETGARPKHGCALDDMFREAGLLSTGDGIPDMKPPQMMDCFRKASRCLLVHNTFSSRDSLAGYISDTDRFYFVLCPCSNLFIQNLMPNMSFFSSPELCTNVCIGTDSLASNTHLSILDEMKIIRQHAPEIPFDAVLRWATLNGATALGYSDMYGSFEQGKTPGVNLITGIDFDRMQLTAESAVKVIV